MRTVIYARFSSDNQNPLSTADQVAICRARADREGWPIVAVFTDEAISGAAGISAAQRPGLHALLMLVESGGIDQVLAESTDRVARHVADAHLVRERIEFSGARLFTLFDGQVTPIIGLVKGFVDSQFRSDLAQRVKRGARAAASRGSAASGVAYGYVRVIRHDAAGEPVRGLRAIDPDRAEIVRRIFREFAAGVSPARIARRLEAEGVPPPRGGYWRMKTLTGEARMGTGMLRNPLYDGRMVYGRTRAVRDPQSRRVRWRPADEPPVEHPAPDLRIVEATLFAEAQALLAAGVGIRPERSRRPKHLLSGLGTCGTCGGSWVKVSSMNWGCARSNQAGSCANTRTLATRVFERRVLAALKADLLAPEAVTAYVREYHREHARRRRDVDRDRAAAERRVAEAERRLARLVDAIAEGGGAFAEVKAAMAKARDLRDAAARELAALAAAPVLALHPGLADAYRRQVDALEAMLAEPEAELEARPRLRAMIARITVTPAAAPKGVEIEVTRHLDEILTLATAPTLKAAG